MTKLLVTGGMGFIGSNFILRWLEGHPVDAIVNLDALTYAANRDELQSIEPNAAYRFIQGDIADGAVLREILSEGVDVIVHFAAETHVDRSISSPLAFVRTNVLGTHTLLQAAKEHGVKRFVLVSTDEVYGSLGASGRFTERSPLAPNSPYSASKAGADLIARAYFETYRFPVLVTRCSNNYGPRQHPEKLMPSIITRAMRDEAIPIYGDGLNVRDWLHVDDHCDALTRVIESGEPGAVYNIGGGNERTNMEIAKLLLRELGKPESLIRFVQDRPGHDLRYAIDASYISEKLGWVPSVPFESGLKETVRWYLRKWASGGELAAKPGEDAR